MSHTHASDVSFSQLNSSGTIKTTIGVSTTATVANISVDIQNNPQIAITGTLTAYRTVSSTGVCSDSIPTGPVSVADGQSTYHHTFKMENLEANHQYCFKYSDDNGVTFAPKVFKTESGILTIPYNWPLISSNATGQKVLVSGKINTATYTGSVGSLAIDLQISANPFPADQPGDSIVGDQTRNYARVNVDTSSPEGVASDGSYYFQITGLAPSRKYYCRQVISFKNTTTILDVKGENCVLDSDQGIVPQGSKLEQSLEEQKSYHLLAPWPGLSELMDPDLCLQKQKEGTLSPNAVCDINGFLDFAFKTLIGITAVMLVLRLMYEGYQYIVTDVPFLKASAKSGFFTALLGLLLALSAYLILNTVNPKLVSNTFSVNSINLEVDDETETTPNTFYDVGGDTKACPQGFIDVSTFGTPNKINVCKTLATNLTAMLTAAKSSNIILVGYGSRSTQRQKQLRISHGCPNDTTPASSCQPPTARPGRSMHERGMAIDFSCNGTSITNHSNSCYVWLTAHAAQYGFKNLSSEPWHWSVNGK